MYDKPTLIKRGKDIFVPEGYCIEKPVSECTDPILQAFLADDDLHAMTLVSTSMGFMNTFTKHL